jgi:hypothetical protein
MPSQIPRGVTFGTKVAVIPPVSGSFSHSGFMEKKGRLHEGYSWIDRGNDLGRYVIEVDKIDVPILKLFVNPEIQKASIPSPVSGLLIHSSYDFGLGLTAILLPDGEQEAADGEFMFQALCHLCEKNKKYFLKPSRYWSKGAFTESIITHMLSEQLSQKCQYVDALPQYRDYFEEARTRHPNLRPYIEHLV